jgi:hypothetical protein
MEEDIRTEPTPMTHKSEHNPKLTLRIQARKFFVMLMKHACKICEEEELFSWSQTCIIWILQGDTPLVCLTNENNEYETL